MNGWVAGTQMVHQPNGRRNKAARAGVIQHVVLNESMEVVKIVVNLSISPKTLS